MSKIHHSSNISIFTVLSVLLEYPNAEQLTLLPTIRSELMKNDSFSLLIPLLDYLENEPDLITLQEDYVATFDRRSAHSLHLFEHIHGESRERGQAMVDLHEEYKSYGLALDTSELPDYIPLFLEFLAHIPESNAVALLGDAIHVLAKIGDKLNEADSPYACVFTILNELTPVEPQPLADAPEGDLEEAMVTFGPDMNGIDATLKSAGFNAGSQPIHFYDSKALRPTKSEERS